MGLKLFTELNVCLSDQTSRCCRAGFLVLAIILLFGAGTPSNAQVDTGLELVQLEDQINAIEKACLPRKVK